MQEYTDCTALLTAEGGEERLEIQPKPRALPLGSRVAVTAPGTPRAAPKFRLEGVVLPFGVNRWGTVAVPAGPETALGGFVARFEARLRRCARERRDVWLAASGYVGDHYRLGVDSALRASPAGTVVNTKPADGRGGARWAVMGEAVPQVLHGLARHKVDLEVALDGLWLLGTQVKSRWRLLSCDDRGPAPPAPDAFGDYAFLDE